MITFQELREKKLKGMPPGEHVFDKKMKGVSVMVCIVYTLIMKN